jgi:hypothetical protein
MRFDQADGWYCPLKAKRSGGGAARDGFVAGMSQGSRRRFRRQVSNSADDGIGPALPFDQKPLSLDHFGRWPDGNYVGVLAWLPPSGAASSAPGQHGRIIHGGTNGSNPLSSSKESGANPTWGPGHGMPVALRRVDLQQGRPRQRDQPGPSHPLQRAKENEFAEARGGAA